MKHHVGLILQLMVLGALPALVVFQLCFGFRLIVMPASLLVGIAVFWMGTVLRESQR